MVVARLSPVPHDHNSPMSGLTVLLDTSASQAHEYGRYVSRLGALLRALERRTPDDIRLQVIAFDQEYEVLFDGPISEFDKGELEQLRRRPPLGASNLAYALQHVSSRRDLLSDRVLVVSDGLVTAGPSRVEELRTEVARLDKVGVRRLDVLTRGDLTNHAIVRALTRSDALDESGLVLRIEENPKRLANKLVRTVVDSIRVSIPGSAWVYPERLEPIQAGDDVVVYAEVSEPGDVDVVLGGHAEYNRRFKLKLHESRRPLMQSAWAAPAPRISR